MAGQRKTKQVMNQEDAQPENICVAVMRKHSSK